MYLINVADDADFVIDSEFVIGEDFADEMADELSDPLALMCAIEDAIEQHDDARLDYLLELQASMTSHATRV